MIEHHEAQTA